LTAEDVLTTLQHQPPMVAFWGADLRNQFASQAYTDRFDIDPTQLFGIDIHDVPGPEATDAGMPHAMAALAGQQQPFTRTTVDAGGKACYTEALYTPHLSAGVVRGFFSVVTDRPVSVVDAVARTDAESDGLARAAMAAERHDAVIELLFSAGLALASAADMNLPLIQDPVLSAIDGIDSAVVALRSPLYQLGTATDAAAVRSSVRPRAGRAGSS